MNDRPTGPDARSRVVIVGAGFGGLAAAQRLARQPVDIIVVDRNNYHLFQPLLYQVATAGLSPNDIAWPVRSILRSQRNTTVLLGKVIGVNTAEREVILRTGSLHYDFLVLATGTRHAYYGHPEWEQVAPGLKRIEDATEIRKRILLAFERAEMTDSADEQQRLLTFVLVGAGPTGVELAGAIAELARKALASDFRHIDTQSTRVLLVEADANILASFPEQLSSHAMRSLSRLGVEIRLGEAISACTSEGVYIGDNFVPAATVLWTAGVQAEPAAAWLNAESDSQGKILVDKDLSVSGHDNIYAIGDAAHIEDNAGQIVPGIAPAAKQTGKFVGEIIACRVANRTPPESFHYRHWGNLATIGRHSAVVEIGSLRLRGYFAWWFWGIAHVYFLISARNRILVAFEWLWSYFTFERGTRLITESWKPRTPD